MPQQEEKMSCVTFGSRTKLLLPSPSLSLILDDATRKSRHDSPLSFLDIHTLWLILKVGVLNISLSRNSIYTTGRAQTECLIKKPSFQMYRADGVDGPQEMGKN